MHVANNDIDLPFGYAATTPNTRNHGARTGISPEVGRYYCRAAMGRIITFLLLLFVVSHICLAQAASSPDQPLAPDRGSAALKLELLRLRTTARMLHTTAHPDDEDGGMLVLESRGRGVTTELLTLTRGEGGQNRLGSNLFDELGALRTLELLASDRYYGVQQRFTRAVDFGFSKTADETFEKWGGQHGPVLADVVRAIRTFRPDVIASRFQGSARDDHGHHQAAAILTREAFRAAADPRMTRRTPYFCTSNMTTLSSAARASLVSDWLSSTCAC